MTSKKISESLMQIFLLRQMQFWQNCTCNLNVYIFCLRFALGIIHGDRCDRKHQKQLFYLNKPPFSVDEFSNTVTFWRNARFYVILTSVTINTGFPLQNVLLWVTCWQRSIKILKHLIIDTSYSLGSSDVITNVNTMTPFNSLFFFQK